MNRCYEPAKNKEGRRDHPHGARAKRKMARAFPWHLKTSPHSFMLDITSTKGIRLKFSIHPPSKIELVRVLKELKIGIIVFSIPRICRIIFERLKYSLGEQRRNQARFRKEKYSLYCLSKNGRLIIHDLHRLQKDRDSDTIMEFHQS